MKKVPVTALILLCTLFGTAAVAGPWEESLLDREPFPDAKTYEAKLSKMSDVRLSAEHAETLLAIGARCTLDTAAVATVGTLESLPIMLNRLSDLFVDEQQGEGFSNTGFAGVLFGSAIKGVTTGGMKLLTTQDFNKAFEKFKSAYPTTAKFAQEEAFNHYDSGCWVSSYKNVLIKQEQLRRENEERAIAGGAVYDRRGSKILMDQRAAFEKTKAVSGQKPAR